MCPNPFYQIYEGAAYLAGAAAVLRQLRPGPQFRLRLRQRAGRRLGARAADVHLLARQPDRRHADAGRLEAAVRAGRPPRLRDRGRRMLFRDLPRQHARRWARWKRRTQLGRSGGDDPYANLVVFSSLSKRSNVPGMRSGFVAGEPGHHQEVPAVPHLLRRRHVAAGAGRVDRGLGRRNPRAGEPRQVPRKIQPRHAAAATK